MATSWRAIPNLLKAAFWRWWNDNTFRLGAALAYYTVFSLAPVVLIALAVAGLFFEKEAARRQLLREINETVGIQVGQAIEAIVQSAESSGTGTIATIVGIVVLVFGATSVFAQLQDALNTIWGVHRKEGTGVWSTVKDRFWSFTIVLGIGFLLMVSLVISAALAVLSQVLTPSALPGGAFLWQSVNWLVSFGLITLLFALIYKLLPDTQIEWEDVWVGAAMTALLFAVGKYLIGLYLGRSSWISGYGAAGSLVVVLLWVYYSSQIFLFGAEFTYVYSNHAGKPLAPKENAEAVTEEARARQGMARRPEQSSAAAQKNGKAHGLFAGTPALHRLEAYWAKLQASYWFLPAVLTALAAVLALVTVHTDEAIQVERAEYLAWVYARGPDGARAVLATIAGSMITVAGVVFSVTIVALSLASNQFGPRLLRNFMRDRGNQVVLGTFVATFVYCLLVLRTVRGVDDNEFVPHVSVTMAIVLSLVSLGVLIYFIHHLAVSIQAPEVVANVANDLHAAIDRLLPEELGQENQHASEKNNDAQQADTEPESGKISAGHDKESRPIDAVSSGYVQALDGDGLLDLAVENDLVIHIRRRPGQFAVSGNALADVSPSDRLDDDLANKIRATFLIGAQQTPFQDLKFVVHQLVEIAVRALSPGFNDPFTALSCLDHLGDGLCHLAGRDIPSGRRLDPQGRGRSERYVRRDCRCGVFPNSR